MRLTTTKSYDYLNRLSSIGSVGTGPSVNSYSYSYSDANQRTRVNLADGSFWVYEYDSLGQVKSGKRYWSDWTPVAGQQFEYGFDDIGNRTSTKAGGDAVASSLRLASYTNNSLNQITGRDVPAYLNAIGAATAIATNVNVNNTLAYRRGEYYRVELNPDNSSAAVWQSVTNRAVQNGTTNSVTGNLFLAKTAEVFSYDADGNLNNDGRWAYLWDGENRLVRQFGPTTGPSGSVKALTFGYDWQGRRISKVVSNYSGGAWSKALDEKYLYDGWNLLGSLNASNNAVVLAFLWGSDLSGSMQGAGGVGGLLAVKATGGSVTFPAFDGNGNVTTLINAAGGDALANYEYGPFGEVIRCSGTAAKPNPFRFSTKFQDDETDLLYYGYRCYNQSTGRWLSRDPIEEKGGKNLYNYVGNEPLIRTDTLGLAYGNPLSGPDGPIGPSAPTRFPLPVPPTLPPGRPTTPEPPIDPTVPPGGYNCGGAAFRTYNYMTLDEAVEHLLKCQQANKGDRCPCGYRKCHYYYIYAWRETNKDTGISVETSIEKYGGDYHIACGDEDGKSCSQKNGSNPIVGGTDIDAYPAAPSNPIPDNLDVKALYRDGYYCCPRTF